MRTVTQFFPLFFSATYKTCSTSDDVLDTLDYSLVDETLLELSEDEKTEIDTLKKELRNGEITKKGFTNKRKKLLESPLKRFMKEKCFEDLFKGGPRDTIKSPMKVPPPAPRPGLPGSPGSISGSSASATGTGGSIGDINISGGGGGGGGGGGNDPSGTALYVPVRQG